MSDHEKKPEQSIDAKQPTAKIDDLPIKDITERDAQAVKGGALTVKQKIAE
jgi:hypothetical protein